MSKFIFNEKKNEPRKRKGNIDENDKREKSPIFLISKTEDKRKNKFLEIRDDNESDLNENFTIELFGEEENILNNENDNDITTFMARKKRNYPPYDNNIKSLNNLSKYIYNKY